MEKTWQGDNDGTPGLQMLQNKLVACQISFSRWSCMKYRNADKIIKKKTNEL